MNGFVDGRLVAGSPEPFFKQVEENPPLKSFGVELHYDIDHISIAINAASVIVRETGFGPYTLLTTCAS